MKKMSKYIMEVKKAYPHNPVSWYVQEYTNGKMGLVIVVNDPTFREPIVSYPSFWDRSNLHFQIFMM